ncbi:hypothetical protein SAMN06265373_109146 [Shimia sagamensis]|uniref:Uncharacterized protein n=1 Tax=Shimia sagamensis TaxID=1566352 RepID=A0ABY1PI04_9RHOB|nr:hypothetical protein SAMN06265373_109146 [Shimia sagamensis]
MLPMPRHNGQAIAQSGTEAKLPLFSVACRGSVFLMERRHNARRSCNSVFRYPSPFGWSCVVPSGSPVFSAVLARRVKTGEIVGIIAAQSDKRSARDSKEGKGTGICVSQQQFLFLRSSDCRLVAAPWASKRSLAPGRAPWRQQQSVAVWQPVRLSAARPTRSIVKNSPPVVERARAPQGDLNCPAELQPVPNPKPSTCVSTAVAFLLPMQAAVAAREDQEGR